MRVRLMTLQRIFALFAYDVGVAVAAAILGQNDGT